MANRAAVAAAPPPRGDSMERPVLIEVALALLEELTGCENAQLVRRLMGFGVA